jgi:hypothetical protein
MKTPVSKSQIKNAIPRVSTLSLLTQASSEPSKSLPQSVATGLQDQFAADFSTVRIHSGPASSAAAERLGARAYTLGRQIFMGPEGHSLSAHNQERLLTHEAVHAAQQGFQFVRPHSDLKVGKHDSAAEGEARRIASPSVALRDRWRQSRQIIERSAPQIQRDLKGEYKGIHGIFNLNLKTESHAGAKSGMSGTIKFKATDSAPDATGIRLLQIARLEDLTANKEYNWTGDEANRMKVMTVADKGIEPGFFVDAVHKNRTPRSSAKDAAVSPFYIDDYKALADPNNTDGSKKGKTITEASLWDYPGWSQKSRFTFETAAKSIDMPYVYASISWGFTISDPAKGKVENEHAKLNNFETATFGAAVKSFDEFYKNPGSSTAPK